MLDPAHNIEAVGPEYLEIRARLETGFKDPSPGGSETIEERRARFEAVNAAYQIQRRAAREAWDAYKAAPEMDTPDSRRHRIALSLLPVFQ